MNGCPGHPRQPKVNQNASQNRPLEKVAKKGRQKALRENIFGVILEPHSLKIDAEIYAEKFMNIDETSMRKWYQNWLDFW